MAEMVNTAGDWWQQNSPSVRSLSGDTTSTGGFGSLGNLSNTATGFTDAQLTGMMNPGSTTQQPTQQGGDPQTLIQQYQQTHPPNDIAGLMTFLQQNGIQVTRPTHAGGTLLSDDKLVINGQMVDLISDVGGAGAKWQYSPEGGGGGLNNLYNPNDLTAGWTQPFQAPSMEEFLNSPGIQSGLKMGEQALERSAASKGTLLTGGLLKDMKGWATDYAAQKYGDVYGRAMGEYGLARDTFFKNQGNLFDRNFSLAQLGQNAASNTGMQGQANANAQSDLYTQQGNAQSAGTIAGTNAWMPTLGAAANAGQDYLFGRTRSSY